MTLYEELIKLGFQIKEIPSKRIDRLSEKYKLISFFHKTKYREISDFLIKNNIEIYFADWFYINISVNGNNRVIFDEQYTIDYIIEYIKKLQHEEIKKTRLFKLQKIIK